MANKVQRNRDKENKKQGKKRPFTEKQVQFSTATSVVKAEPKAIKSPVSSHQLIGKCPWSHLIQMNPKKTHLNQANASARKKWLSQERAEADAVEAAEAKALGLTVPQLGARRVHEAEEKKRLEEAEYWCQFEERRRARFLSI